MTNPIQSLLSGLFGAASKDADELRQALQRAVEVVDPQLRSVGGFERRLSPGIRSALDYADTLIDRLPGPLAVSRPAFAADPVVHAVFATAPDIEKMLGTSQAVRDYLHETESYGIESFHALFAARRVEKRQLGMAMLGDVLRSDVPQTVIYFADHTITEPVADPAQLRAHLRMVFFDSLLKSFTAHLGGLREERESVRAGLSMERAHLTVLRGKRDGAEYAVHTRRVAELDAQLREIGGELAPSAMIDTLAGFLAQPESAIRLEPYSVTIDRLGVVVDPPPADPAAAGLATLHFPEMVARDRRRYLVMLAKIDVAEAREAVERVTAEQRRFVII
jgi:hypothetical protein